jgi:hypothetical protein
VGDDSPAVVEISVGHAQRRLAMQSLLEHCSGARSERLEPGTVLLVEGQGMHRLEFFALFLPALAK